MFTNTLSSKHLLYFEGTSKGTNDVLPFTSVGLSEAVTIEGLHLKPGRAYYASVRGNKFKPVHAYYVNVKVIN